MKAAEVAAVLESLGFTVDGATHQETVRVPTRRSPVLGRTGGELRTLGGRARYALPGTNIRATVGARTTFLYHVHGAGRTEAIAHLATREVTLEGLRELLGLGGES